MVYNNCSTEKFDNVTHQINRFKGKGHFNRYREALKAIRCSSMILKKTDSQQTMNGKQLH